MINVFLNDSSFSYDVHSLTKAFYPSEDVKILLPEKHIPQEEGMSVNVDDCMVRIRIHGAETEDTIPKDCPRHQVKNILKKTLYHALCEDKGHSLPWGTLSGIRPVKVPMRMLMSGKTEAETRAYFQETYLADDSRTVLALAIAGRELAVLKGEETLSSGKAAKGGLAEILGGYSLYVSIPFCPSICLYCSFPSGTIGTYRNRIEEYLAVLEKELSASAEMMRGQKLLSVYIGGGTPTSLSPEQLLHVMNMIERHFDCSSLLEYTMEAGRPDTITREHLLNMRQCGVNRVSVNPQTMHQKTLDLIGRCHTVEDTQRAFARAREAGFEDVNADLIIGLPGEGKKEIRETLDAVSRLDPDALTVHSLAVKRSSRLHEKLEEYGSRIEPVPETTMDAIISGERANGLTPYYLYRQKNIAGNLENIGFAKKGKAGFYNIIMMEELHTVIACGAGAISKIVYPGLERIERAANVSDIANYLARGEEMIERKKNVLSAMREAEAMTGEELVLKKAKDILR